MTPGAHHSLSPPSTQDMHGHAVISAATGKGPRMAGGREDEQSTVELMRLSDALEEADALRVSVRSKEATLKAQVRPPHK